MPSLSTRPLKAVCILLLLLAPLASAGDWAYMHKVKHWRHGWDKLMHSSDSPLAVVARAPLSEGDTLVGSDPAAAIVLPAEAPRRLGVFTRHNSDITFTPEAGIQLRVNGKRPPGHGDAHILTLHYSDGGKPGDRLGFGRYAITLRLQGNRYMLSFWDPRVPQVRDFKGIDWFPVNPAYRVSAQFAPSPERDKRTISVTTSDGLIKHLTIAGEVTFQMNGKTLHLPAYDEDKSLFLLFRDQTSGKTSYGGGRYLDAPLPKDGKTVLDFNEVYNPYCAYNHFWSCIVPPRENTVDTAIPAGAAYRNAETH